MDRREFIATLASGLAVATAPISLQSVGYHPAYLKIARKLNFSSSEMGDKMGVLVASDGIDKAWIPIRFDDLCQGDVFRLVSPYDGPVKGSHGLTGEWKALDNPYQAPNSNGKVVGTIVTEELPL